jgi:hypothetical protein
MTERMGEMNDIVQIQGLVMKVEMKVETMIVLEHDVDGVFS